MRARKLIECAAFDAPTVAVIGEAFDRAGQRSRITSPTVLITSSEPATGWPTPSWRWPTMKAETPKF